MSGITGDPAVQLAFSVYENKGVLAALVCSGLSRAADIPTGWEITLDLVRRVALAQGVNDQPDWAGWYRSATGQEPNYSTLLEDLASSPEERRSILHNYIEPTQEDREAGRKVPTAAHHEIAALVRGGYIRVIITTNFDRLLENALRERGIEPTVVASVDALSGAQPLTHSPCYILKLHGDYKDARILNTESELGDYPAAYNVLLDRIFDEYGLIICGWSGEWDHALRAALLRAPSRRYPIYWAARGKLGSRAEELAEHRRARIIPITDADSFFKGLRQKIETLEQSQRQNPLSVELLVASAKRFLAKPEYRIQLDELLTETAERLATRIEVPELSGQGGWSQSEFRARVSRYEAATEPLARMVGVLGRWGDGSEMAIVQDVIRTLYSNAERIGNGLRAYLGLRSYPAVLIFTAYGLGLTRAERWGDLHRLFFMDLVREGHEPQRTVELLFLSSWAGGEKDVWNNIDGLDRRKTPLSDHMMDILSDWGRSFAGLSPDFELMYERFEILGALAHFEANDEEKMQQAADANPHDSFAWMPLGRIGWHSSNLQKLIREIQSEAMTRALSQGGFARRATFLRLFIDNLTRMARRMGW